MHKYQYFPIKLNEIRLLTLLPASSFDDGIQIYIDAAILSKRIIPRYEAISYVWGTEENREKITVLGDESSQAWYLFVTRNLIEALPYLRYKDKPRLLWIDAICVNQEDLKERGHQVNRMADIFRYAETVTAWLGPEVPKSTEALRMLEVLGSQVEVNPLKGFVKPALGRTVDWSKWDDLLPYRRYLFSAVYSLIKRPWFRRVWIRQEINLANDQAILKVGPYSMLWNVFYAACYYFEKKMAVHAPQYFNLPNIQLYLRDVQSIGQAGILQDHGLKHSYWKTRFTRCSDPRDRVFGMINIVHRLRGIQPDYTMSVSQVFQQVVLNDLAQSRALDFLSCNELQEQSNTDIPTWAPDWSRPSKYDVLVLGHPVSGCAHAEASYLPGGILEVTGLNFATVAKVFTFADYRLGSIQMIKKLISTIGFSSLDISETAWLRACSRTLLGNNFAEHWHPVSESGISSVDAEDVLLEIDKYPEKCAVMKLSSKTAEYLGYFRRFAKGRSFLVFCEGYIGMGSALTRPGDKACVVLGCNSLLTLRECEDERFKIVGEVYVDRMSDGESLLGPLPHEYRLIRRWSDETSGYWPSFLNTETGKILVDDPRLGPLPSDWSFKPHDQQHLWNWYFKNSGTIDKQSWKFKGDPRISADALRKRGVPLRKIKLE
jgi:hypothetical protein